MLSQLTVNSFFSERQATDTLPLAKIATICENMHRILENVRHY